DVEQKLKEIVAEQLGVEQSKVTMDASFASDLGADSLDVVEMVMKIEEEFGVELPDERAEEVQNLKDAIRVVKELMA
ncbi:acyl carrier protein, partial [Pelagophyceae sp. CCMP2097]